MNKTLAFCLILLFAFAGCDSVTIDKPFGQRIDAPKMKSVVGVWTDREKNIFEFRISNNQELVGGQLDWDEPSQRFTCKSGVLDVRTLADTFYLFLTEENKSVFCRVELVNANQIRLFLPDPSKFRDAVKAGALSGTIMPAKNDNFHVRITADAKLLPLLSSDDWQKYYLVDTAIEFTRLTSKE